MYCVSLPTQCFKIYDIFVFSLEIFAKDLEMFARYALIVTKAFLFFCVSS